MSQVVESIDSSLSVSTVAQLRRVEDGDPASSPFCEARSLRATGLASRSMESRTTRYLQFVEVRILMGAPHCKEILDPRFSATQTLPQAPEGF